MKTLKTLAGALMIGSTLAVALPHLAAAQSTDALAGPWEYHPEKSTFAPGPPRYKSVKVTFNA